MGGLPVRLFARLIHPVVLHPAIRRSNDGHESRILFASGLERRILLRSHSKSIDTRSLDRD